MKIFKFIECFKKIYIVILKKKKKKKDLFILNLFDIY